MPGNCCRVGATVVGWSGVLRSARFHTPVSLAAPARLESGEGAPRGGVHELGGGASSWASGLLSAFEVSVILLPRSRRIARAGLLVAPARASERKRGWQPVCSGLSRSLAQRLSRH